MELYDSENMDLRSQVTNKIPIFEVNNIDPSVPIKLYLYAENAKGTSDPAVIDDSAQNHPKHNVEGIAELKFILLYMFFVSGVTDFKAVKDSSTSEMVPTTSISLFVITSSLGGIFIVSILTLCVIFTYKRKVKLWHLFLSKLIFNVIYFILLIFQSVSSLKNPFIK